MCNQLLHNRPQSCCLSAFVKILNECRVGNPSSETITALQRLKRPFSPELLPDLQPVQLYAIRALVERTNQRRLDALPGPLFQYHAHDRSDDLLSLPYYSDLPVDPLLGIKSGAQVMLRKNLGNGLFNGSIGVVVSFLSVEELIRCGNLHAQWADGCVRQIDISNLPSSSNASEGLYPVVCFETPVGDEHVYCRPEMFHVEDSRGQIVSVRVQV